MGGKREKNGERNGSKTRTRGKQKDKESKERMRSYCGTLYTFVSSFLRPG